MLAMYLKYFRYIASIFLTLHKRLWYFRYIASIFLTLHKRLWSERVLHIMISFIEDCCEQGSYCTKGS